MDREISGEIKRVENKADLAARRHRLDWYRWLVLVVTAVLGPCIAIWISRENLERSEQRQCKQILSQISVYEENAPQTPAGIGQYAANRALANEFRCYPIQRRP